MKIILIAAVQNLGRIGDVVEVKNGYAKNFLIPNKKAICFTVNNYKIFEAKKQEFEQENSNNFEKANSLKGLISGRDIIVIENASDDGRLYGSVNSAVIADKINQMNKQKLVSRLDIFLKKPIKEIGVYQIKLAPHSEVSFDVRLIVTRNESEVEALLKSEKKNKGSESSEASASADAEVKSEKPKRAKKAKEEESSEAAE